MSMAAAAALLCSCNDAEYAVGGGKNVSNGVYIAQAAGSSKSEAVTMTPAGADVSIYVRLARLSNADVTADLRPAPELLAAYNAGASAQYEPLPQAAYTFPAAARVVIPAGEIGAAYTLHVNNFDLQGKRYALAVAIAQASGADAVVVEDQAGFIYSFAQPLYQNVPRLWGRMGTSDAPQKLLVRNAQWNLSQFTLECWARMTGYQINNQALLSLGDDPWTSDNECYIRFGDANSPYNYLQIKARGDGGKQTARDLAPNAWYHWAFVYDGRSMSVYRNGDLDFSYEPPLAGTSYKFDYFEMISSGSYFRDSCDLAQVRFWNTARSQSQIKGNMYYAADPSDASLLLYLPMGETKDDAAGRYFEDISGNGHHADILGDRVFRRWIPDVDFKN
jgi:hypothetical protein